MFTVKQNRRMPIDAGMAKKAWRIKVALGLYPIVTFQYSSTTLYQFSYHIQYLFFESDNRI
jgi:hypothetical protein